jgi:thiamine biosynthesis lipoprotein
MELHRFRSMGCDIVVRGAGAAERLRVEELFEERDAVFSRFRQGSELNRVNASSGRAVAVSGLFARALESALEAAAETDGLVDPTLGAAIEAAGYSRDFAELEPDPRPAEAGAVGSWQRVRLTGTLLRVDPGVSLDLNGVVKAVAVDDALALLGEGGLVSAGGDLAASGEVDVGLPGGSAVRLVQGGLATSGTVSRRWMRGGELQHHLIDPRTGRPARSPWLQVTVCGRTCLAADTAAKAAFLLGDDGPAWLEDRALPGRFMTTAGDVVVTENWRSNVEEPAACI